MGKALAREAQLWPAQISAKSLQSQWIAGKQCERGFRTTWHDQVWATDHWMEIMNNSPGAGEASFHILLWHVVLDIVMNLNHKQTKPAEALLSKPLKDILDVLSVRPEAENHTYNPVPRHVTCTCHESRNSFCLLDTCITVRVLAVYHRITVS